MRKNLTNNSSVMKSYLSYTKGKTWEYNPLPLKYSMKNVYGVDEIDLEKGRRSLGIIEEQLGKLID